MAAASEHHASYALAVAGEIAHFLTQATARPASFPGRDGSVVPAQVLVVVGGCFAALWGETSVGGPDHREAWRHADANPLADGHAVAQWLWNDSSLPAGILRRLAPEPLVLRSLDRAEADRLAERLRDACLRHWIVHTIGPSDFFVTPSRTPYEVRSASPLGQELETISIHLAVEPYQAVLAAIYPSKADEVDFIDYFGRDEDFMRLCLLCAGMLAAATPGSSRRVADLRIPVRYNTDGVQLLCIQHGPKARKPSADEPKKDSDSAPERLVSRQPHFGVAETPIARSPSLRSYATTQPLPRHEREQV